jgi:flagellar hook-basal body complex protein FliE
MDGFSVSKADRFLQTGAIGDSKSVSIEKPSVAAEVSQSGNTKSFADTLKEAIGDVNQLQKAADKAAQDLATGRTDNVADVMIATEKADVALRVMVQVRNKIIDAYQEIMKMQV